MHGSSHSQLGQLPSLHGLRLIVVSQSSSGPPYESPQTVGLDHVEYGLMYVQDVGTPQFEPMQTSTHGSPLYPLPPHSLQSGSVAPYSASNRSCHVSQ